MGGGKEVTVSAILYVKGGLFILLVKSIESWLPAKDRILGQESQADKSVGCRQSFYEKYANGGPDNYFLL